MATSQSPNMAVDSTPLFELDPARPAVPRRAAFSRRDAHPMRSFVHNLARAIPYVTPPVFYFATCCRHIGLGDNAILIDQLVRLHLGSHVNVHNLTVLVGHLFSRLPFLELAHRCNLMSVAVGGATVALFYYTLLRTSERRLLSFLLSTVFMVSHSMWWHSTIVENYAFNALFTVLAILLIQEFVRSQLDRYFYALCALAGLSVFNHASMGILAAGAAAVLIASAIRDVGGVERRIVRGALAFIIGWSPWLLILAKDLYRSSDPMETLRWAIGGDFTELMFQSQHSPLFVYVEWIVLQFPSFFLVFLPLGFGVSLYRKDTRVTATSMGLAAAINIFFFMHFVTWDQFAFYLPSFVVFAWLGSLGVHSVYVWCRPRRGRPILIALLALSIPMPPILYSKLTTSDRAKATAIGFRFDNEYTHNTHDCAEYIANPNKRSFTSVAEFAELVFSQLPAGALLIDDDSRTYSPLAEYYQRHLGRRPDLRIDLINSWGFSNWGLDQNGFFDVVTNYPGRVFVLSDGHPYHDFLGALSVAGYETRQFKLDETRWIFEIVQANTRNRAALPVTQMYTGLSLNTEQKSVSSHFVLDDDIMVECIFAPLETATPVFFEWLAPDGTIAYLSEPYTVAIGQEGVWSILQLAPQLRAPGRWVVTAISAGQRVRSSIFTLEAGSLRDK